MNEGEGARALPQSLQVEIRGFVETSAFELKKFLPRLEIVERTRIDAAIRELMFQASGRVRDDNFLGVGRMLGADHLLLYDVTATSDAELVDIAKGGANTHNIRAVSYGKVIRVESGTVIFQQMAEQRVRASITPAQIWNLPELKNGRDLAVQSSLSGLFMTLLTANQPSPTGIVWGPERGGNRVQVHYVLVSSPGYYAGVRRGDIITAIDGNPVRIGDRTLDDLEMIPRELAQITIERNGQVQTLTVRTPMRNSVEKSPSLSKP